jgi:hypothetical protein
MTINDLKREAKKHGATIETDDGGRWYVYQCCTPKGKTWDASGTHMLCVTWRDAMDKDDAINDALERMQHGVSDCDDENCDYCHPEEE